MISNSQLDVTFQYIKILKLEYSCTIHNLTSAFFFSQARRIIRSLSHTPQSLARLQNRQSQKSGRSRAPATPTVQNPKVACHPFGGKLPSRNLPQNGVPNRQIRTFLRAPRVPKETSPVHTTVRACTATRTLLWSDILLRQNNLRPTRTA